MMLVLFLLGSVLGAQSSILSFAPAQTGVQVGVIATPLGNGRSRIEATLNIPRGLHVDLNLDVLGLEVEGLPASAGVESLNWSAPSLRQGVPSFQTQAVLSRVVYGLEGPVTAQVRVGWQACNEEGLCLLPESTIIGVTLDPGFVVWSEFWLYLLFAFLGGLFLNVMPCILPLLTIKAAQLARSSQSTGRSRLLLAASYTAGLLTAMLLVSVLLILARSLGHYAGWGMHLQNPAFVLASVSLLWVLALSLWGLYLLPALGSGSALPSLAGSFLMGLGAVFVAAPCSAPFLGAGLSFAFSLPMAAIPIFLMVAGLGFSLPLVVLTLAPSLKRFLPQSASWFDLLEKILGFVLGGYALYLLSSLFGVLAPQSLVLSLGYLFGVSLVFFLMGRLGGLEASTLRRRLVWGLGLSLTVAAFFLVQSELRPAAPQSAQTETSLEADGWVAFDRDRLNLLLSRGQPVFVDIWAEWCTNCKINHATVLADRSLLTWLDDQGITRLRGNLTLPNPEIEAWLKEHRRLGLPVYAYYPALQSTPIFLPELLSVESIKATVQGTTP